MPDAGRVYFDTDKVRVRVLDGLLNQCFAVAETNFQNDWSMPAKYGPEVQRFDNELNAIVRPQFVKRFLLRRRQPADSSDEAADGSFARDLLLHEAANSKEE